MKPETTEYIEAIIEEGSAILAFVSTLTYETYLEDKKTRYAAERGFEIIGEALNRIKRSNPEILEQIPCHRSIISFRNILAHAYDHVEDRIVWGIIESDLPILIQEANRLQGK